MSANGGRSRNEIKAAVEVEYQRALRAIEQARKDALREADPKAAGKTFIARMRRFIGI